MDTVTYALINGKLAETTTRTSRDLLRNARAFGEKQCIVSFITDDGFATDYSILKPIFVEAGIPISFAVIAGDTSGRITDEQYKEGASLGWEFASHSMSHPSLPTLTEAEIDYELRESKKRIEAKGVKCDYIVYPYGDHDEKVRKIAKKYYKFGVATGGALNSYPIDTYAIKRVALGASFDAPDKNTLAYYKSMFDEAYAKGQWIVYMLHASSPEFDATQQQHLRDVIAYVKSFNVPVLTLGEAFDLVGNMVSIGDGTSNENLIITNYGELKGAYIEKGKYSPSLSNQKKAWLTGTGENQIIPIDFLDKSNVMLEINGIATTVHNPTIVSVGKNVWGGIKAAEDIVKAVNNPAYAYLTMVDGRRVLALKGSTALLVDFFSDGFLENTRYTMTYYARRSDTATANGGGIRFKYTDDTVSGSGYPTSTTWEKIAFSSASGKSVKAMTGNYGSIGQLVYIDVDTIQVEVGTTSTTLEPYVESKLELITDIASGDVVKQESDKWYKNTSPIDHYGSLTVYKNGTIYVKANAIPIIKMTYPLNAKAAQELTDKQLSLMYAKLKSLAVI